MKSYTWDESSPGVERLTTHKCFFIDRSNFIQVRNLTCGGPLRVLGKRTIRKISNLGGDIA